MQENIYAAPEAVLTNTEADAVQPAFYVVSPAKFITLYIFTFSFYSFYWHFKNWKQYKIAYDDHEPMPIMRAIFSIFFTHALFSVVDVRLKDKTTNFTWMPTLWATLAVISLIAERIINQITFDGLYSGIIVFMPLPLMLIYGLSLLQAQLAINSSCNDPEGKFNRNFSVANCVWIFVGTIFYSLIVVSIFLPDTLAQ